MTTDTLVHTEDVYPQMLDSFPLYDQNSLPSIPPSWTDISWHNDMCPCFQTDTGHIVFIDWPASYQREFPDSPRFSAHTADGCEVDFKDELASDDWSAIIEWVNK